MARRSARPRWPTAGSATSSAAASTATRPTPRWLVPHFEQMLYDNAQLARVYLHAWAATGDAALSGRGHRRARLPGARAADRRTARSPRARTPTPRAWRGRPSSGRATEIRAVDGRGRGRCSPRRTTSPTSGNWEGAHDPVAGSARPRSLRHGSSSRSRRRGAPGGRAGEAPRAIAPARPQPARDDKVLAAWNGLAIAAFADAARYLRTDPRPEVQAQATATGTRRSRPPTR